MSVVIQIVGLVNGETTTGFEGQYLTDYDPGRNGYDLHGREMLCYLRTTQHVGLARRFPSVIEARDLWAAVDPRQPVRGDGRPNRPLTAFTVSFTPGP